MAIRKTLTSIVLAGALALGVTGCRNNSEYIYNGKIGEDQVTLIEKPHFFISDENLLTITKSDGRVIKYIDISNSDLKLEYVEITADGQTTRYIKSDEVGKPILGEAQKQFDVYIQQIKEIRIYQGLDSLK